MWDRTLSRLFRPKIRSDVRVASIVGDAGIADGHVAEGRLIPLVILDAEERPDLKELVRAHAGSRAGDVDCQWGQINQRSDRVALMLHFMKPVEVSAALEFEIVRQGILVEQILVAKCLYLQPGKVGDRLSNTFNEQRILVEVPDTGFRPTWDVLLQRHLVADFRQRGLSRQQAKAATKGAIEKLREFNRQRAKRGGEAAVIFGFDDPLPR
jgi:hypothetical protein